MISGIDITAISTFVKFASSCKLQIIIQFSTTSRSWHLIYWIYKLNPYERIAVNSDFIAAWRHPTNLSKWCGLKYTISIPFVKSKKKKLPKKIKIFVMRVLRRKMH